MIRGSLAGIDAELFLKLVQNSARALYVACGAEADADGIFSLRFKVKLRIKGRYSVNLLQRNAERCGDFRLNLYRQIARRCPAPSASPS